VIITFGAGLVPSFKNAKVAQETCQAWSWRYALHL
jgi:hypothetical protein